MTDRPDGDRLAAIAATLETVASQLHAVTAELRDLGAPTGSATPNESVRPQPEQPAAQAPQPGASFQPYPSTQPFAVPPSYGPPSPYPQPQWQGQHSFPAYPMPPQQPPYQQKPTLGDRLSKEGAGSKVLVWIGGTVTLIGLVLMLVLAIQRGWIGPIPRVLIGAVLGVALVGVSLRAHRTPAGRPGAFALAATGIAGLYLDAVAATGMLELIPSWVGLLAALVVAVAGLVLAGRWNSQPLAVFVLVSCAFFAPFVTQGFDVLLLGFLLVLMLASVPAFLMRGWMWAPLAGGLPPVLVASLPPTLLLPDGTGPVAAIVVAVVVSLLVIGVALLAAVRDRNEIVAPVLMAVAAAPTLLLGFHVPARISAAGAMVLAVVLVTVWALARMRDVMPKPSSMTAGAVGAVCVMVATGELLPADGRAIALLGEAMVLAYVAWALRSNGVLIAATAFGSVGTVWAMATVATPGLVLLAPSPVAAPTKLELVVGVFGFLLIAGAALCVVLSRSRLDAHPGGTDATAANLVGALPMLYGTSGAIVCLALLPLTDRTGFLVGHVLVTVGWMAAALVLLQRGIVRKGPRIAGFVLVGAALVKLVLFDMSTLDGIARVAAFLGAGLVLLFAGPRYTRLITQRAAPTSAPQQPLQHPPYGPYQPQQPQPPGR